MARVTWSGTALNNIGDIITYLDANHSGVGGTIGLRLLALGDSLKSFPNCGRPSGNGTREMTGVPPYVLRYEVAGDVVTILFVRHGRRRPVPA